MSKSPKVLLVLIAVFFLWACAPEKNEAPNPFTSVSMETVDLGLKRESIRALEIQNHKVFYSGLRRAGFFEIDPQGHPTAIRETIHPEDTVGYRSLAVTSNAYFFVNVGSPAHFYRKALNSASWTLVHQESHPKAFYDSMKFWDDSEGICIGDPIEKNCTSILITRDGGNTWKPVDCAQLPQVSEGEASFAASNTCIAVKGDRAWVITGGTKARVLHTTDRGRSWNIYPTPMVQGASTEGIFSVDFYDERQGFIIGGDYKNPSKNKANKCLTRDGGRSWETVSDGQTPNYKSCVQFVPRGNAKALVAIGFTGIDYSKDGGHSWTTLSTDSSFYTLRFFNDSVAYAAGINRVAKLTFKR